MNFENRTPWTRREFLWSAAKGGVGATLAAAAYGGFFERQHILVRRVEVALRRLPDAFDGFTIAQLSDLHYHPYFSADVIRKAVTLVLELQPDLVALTGDYVIVSVFRKYDLVAAEAAHPCAELLAPLKAKFGIHAVLGNHDCHTEPALVTEALTNNGVRVLHNEAVPLERDGARVWLAGVGDVLAGQARLDATLKSIPYSESVILLAHEPDFADVAATHPVDLQLSGHSHGGQVNLPIIGPPALPELGRKYPRGLRTIGRTQLYTNVGVGTIFVPIRLFATPEVTLITLRTKH